MPLYRVRVPITATCSIYVTAKNKDEAREFAALEEIDPNELYDIQMDAITENLEAETIRRVNK